MPGRNRENTSGFFTWLTHSLRRQQRPATVPPPRSVPPLRTLGPPAPQTSLIFELSNELILSILFPGFPDQRYASRYARFHSELSCSVDHHDHRRRVKFLRPLSMTCRAMRLRLVPWIWNRLEMPRPVDWDPERTFVRRLNSITNAFLADIFLASSVKFMIVDFPWGTREFTLFVECLESLPNLHTLETGWARDSITAPLKDALKGAKLPKIKTLIIPPAAHPLLRHCLYVEDVVWVVKYRTMLPDGLLKSLASNRDSRVKRLTIPLVMWDNTSRFIAACPRLTELTVIFPYPGSWQPEILPDPAGWARPEISELVFACKALPDFDTLQIVGFSLSPYTLLSWCGQDMCSSRIPSPERWERALDNQTEDLGKWAIGRLKELRTGCRERKRGKTTVRAIEFGSSGRSIRVKNYEAYTNVEEYEV